MSRHPLRAKRPRQSDPLEQPSVSQVYYPDDVHRLLRQIGGSDSEDMQREHQPAVKVQVCDHSEPVTASEKNSSEAGRSSWEPREQMGHDNPDIQQQNQRQEQAPQPEPSIIINAPSMNNTPSSDLPEMGIVPLSNLPVTNNIQVNRPEVIDLDKLPAMIPQGSTDVVDLTLDTGNDVSVVDLTVDSPGTHVEPHPVIVHVNREPSDRPSCRFAAPFLVHRQLRSSDDEIQELPLAQKSSGGGSKAEEDIDANSKRAITCPVCLDDYQMIKRRKRQLMSTNCGHIFCDKCIKDVVQLQSRCPTCRKKLTQRQMHPIFL